MTDLDETVLHDSYDDPYSLREVLELLRDARGYITPTLSTHEEISAVLGGCDCGYCDHVPKAKQ